jgi:hypothetical protein
LPPEQVHDADGTDPAELRGERQDPRQPPEEFIEVATLLERTKMLTPFLDRWAAEWHLHGS